MTDPFEYYRNLIDAALVSNDEEERCIIIENGIKELVERDEVESTSRDIAGSRIVQKLIELAPIDGAALSYLAEPFSKNWFALATDRFSSYVLEDYLKRLAAIPTSKISTNKAFNKFFRVVCKVTRLNVDECLPHARASHVIRGLICALAAIRCFPKGVGDDAIRLLSPGISLKYRKRLITLACCMTSSKVISSTALFARLCNDYAAPVYCTLLKVSKYRFPEEFRIEFCKAISKCIHSVRKDSDGVCRDEVLGHVLNDLILAVPPSSGLFDKLLGRYLRIGKEDEEEHVKSLATDPLGNYSIQTALRALNSSEQFSAFSQPILNSMTALFNSGCIGVVTQLVRAAIRLLSPSSEIPPFASHLNSELARVLSCVGSAEKGVMIVPCLFYYLPFDHLPKSFDGGELPSPNLPGCLLLEALFALPDPSVYFSSLVTANGFLSSAASTAEGYHVISEVLAAKNIPASSKTEIVACLVAPKDQQPPKLLPMATTHFGCLTYKAVWDAMPEQRETIARYLCQFPDALRESKFGRFLFAAFALRLFSLNPQRWSHLKVASDLKTNVGGTGKVMVVNNEEGGGGNDKRNYNNNQPWKRQEAGQHYQKRQNLSQN